MPKVVDYHQKKLEIMKKAKEIFATKGYYNTNICDISKKCGMGRTTIYQYFKNKEEIFYYTSGKTLERIEVRIESIINNNNLSFIEKLKSLIFEVVNEREHSSIVILLEVWIVLKRENNEILNRLKENVQYLKTLINSLICQGIQAKEIKSVDSESMTNTIFSFIQSFVLQVFFNNNLDVHKQLNSINVLIDGLRA